MGEKLAPVLSPRLWGDTYWGVMHNLAAAVQHIDAPVEKQKELRAYFLGFLSGIPFILPCLACRDNAPAFFVSRLSKTSVLTSDLDLLMCDLHNDVNAHLQKTIVTAEISKLRVSDLNLFRVNTCQIWRFVIIIARSTDPQMLKTRHFKNTIDCLSRLLRGLGHADLALAISKILAPMCTMCRLFPIYKKWHTEHKLPCPETLQDFIHEHKLDEND